MPQPARAHAVIAGVATALLAGVGLWIGSFPFDSAATPWDPNADQREPVPPTQAPTSSPRPSTPTSPTTPPPAKPLAGITIVLDPGHNSENAANTRIVSAQVPDGRGGTKACNSTGTLTPDGYPEYEFNWDVADRTRALLEDDGATVVLTREQTGIGPCVNERGAAAEAADADLMISIHGNGSGSPAPWGFFVMIVDTPLNEAQGEPSEALAAAISGGLQAEGFTPSAWAGEIVRRDDLATLNHSTRPVVMLELAEFKNPEESQAVQDPQVRQRYAQGLAAGAATWVADQ